MTVGIFKMFRGQRYECISVEPYIRRDGVEVQLASWLSHCATCGQPFEFKLTVEAWDRGTFRGPTRRAARSTSRADLMLGTNPSRQEDSERSRSTWPSLTRTRAATVGTSSRPVKPTLRSGNPKGRPIGARQKISEQLLADLAVVWEHQGEFVLRRLAIEDPGKLAQIAYGLLPRDVFISVEQRTPGNLDPDEWAILRRVIDLIQATAKGADLGPVLETIENALRADQAR